MDLIDIFPAYGLRVACGPVTLRALRESDVPRVSELAAGGIHPEGSRPFRISWNLSADQPMESLQHYYGLWATFAPAAWTLMLAVERDGVMVGVQDVMTHDYAVLRSAETGSWLGLPHHGAGTGTLMRQAVLSLMFDHLGAVEMRSAAWVDNVPSHRVSEKCGYALDGTTLHVREGAAVREDRLVVTPTTFRRPEYDVVVTGLDPFRRALASTDHTPAATPRRIVAS